MTRPTRMQSLLWPPSFLRGALGLLVAGVAPFGAAEIAMREPLDHFPTTVFFLAVMVATLLGRLAAGALAVITSTLLLTYHFTDPVGSLGSASLEDVAALASFTLVALLFADILARRELATARLEEDRQRLAFIGDVGDALSRTMDYEERLREVARLAVPQLGDWCAVHLEENGRPRLVAVAHVDPDKVRFAEELQTRYPPDLDAPTGVPNVLRTGASELYAKLSRKMIQAAARDAEHLKIIKSLGMRSALVVPIRAHGTTIGVLTLISAESRRRYGSNDVTLAEELGERAGLAIENARLYRERDHIAATLQRALLPPELPEIDGFELRAFYRAALKGTQVGGDFYDVFPMPDGTWMAVMGDVCGKGPEAAALTGFVRHTVRALAVHEPSPAAILDGVNRALLASVEGEQFSTITIARVEPARDGARLVVSSGGHPRPVVVRADGAIEPLGTYGVIVGAFEGPRFIERRARLKRSETLLLYTDGLTSKDEGDSFAERSRLSRTIARLAGQDTTRILGAIQEYVTDRGEGDPEDDVAVLAIRALPPATSGASRASSRSSSRRGGSAAPAQRAIAG